MSRAHVCSARINNKAHCLSGNSNLRLVSHGLFVCRTLQNFRYALQAFSHRLEGSCWRSGMYSLALLGAWGFLLGCNPASAVRSVSTTSAPDPRAPSASVVIPPSCKPQGPLGASLKVSKLPNYPGEELEVSLELSPGTDLDDLEITWETSRPLHHLHGARHWRGSVSSKRSQQLSCCWLASAGEPVEVTATIRATVQGVPVSDVRRLVLSWSGQPGKPVPSGVRKQNDRGESIVEFEGDTVVR